MSTFYNGQEKKPLEQQQQQQADGSVYLPPIQQRNLDVGQKRTVPWSEDGRETKTQKVLISVDEKRGKKCHCYHGEN